MWVVLLCWLLSWASPATAGDGRYIDLAETAHYYQEPAGPMDIDQITQATIEERFLPLPRGMARLGLTERPAWLRIQLPVTTENPVYVELANPLIDEATLYVPDAKGGYQTRQIGDTIAFARQDLAYRNPVIRIDAPASAPLYLRVADSGSLAIPPRLWNTADLMSHIAASERGYGLCFGVMLAMLLYNLVLFGFQRDPTILLYVASVLGTIVAIATINGLCFQYFWPQATEWANQAPSFFSALSVVLASAFALQFLRMRHYARSLRWPTIALIGAGSVGALLALFADAQVAIHSITLFDTATPLVLFAAGLLSWRNGRRPARAFALGWGVFLVGSVTHTFYLWGWLPIDGLAINSLEIGAAAQVLLLSIGLADHLKLLRQESDFAHKSSNRILARLNEQLESVVEKRTVELAQAKQRVEAINTELQQHNRQLYELAIRDGLTGLLNRKTFLQRLETRLIEASRYRYSVAVLMLDLDDFKPINDTYGHIVGDSALKAVADTLMNELRESDACGRFGGEEFVVLLPHTGEGEDGTESACAAAERLRAAIQAVRIEDQDDIRLTVSIGATWAAPPMAHCRATTLLEVADAALYRAKNEGKNRVSCVRACLALDQNQAALQA